jgi:hypothetical protein
VVNNNSKDGKLPRTLSEALADLPALEAARRAESSRRLAEAGPEFTEISAEECVILSHLLAGEYSKAAEKARKHGFGELANDAAEFSLKYSYHATDGAGEKPASSREKSAFDSCRYIVASLSAVVAAWAVSGFPYSRGCNSRMEEKLYERAFTRENPSESAPANYAPLKKRLLDEAFAYIKFTLNSRRLVGGVPCEVTQMQIKEFPNPKKFRVESNGTCTGGSSAAWFLVTLTSRKDGKLLRSYVKLDFTCTSDGKIMSTDTWSIDETKGASRLPQASGQDSARTFCGKSFPHRKQPRPNASKQMHRKYVHPKMRRTC